MTRGNPLPNGTKPGAEAGFAAMSSRSGSENLKEGDPPLWDGRSVVGPGVPVPGQNDLTSSKQPAVQTCDHVIMPIVIEATLVHYTAGGIFCCAILELDDGFRLAAMVRPPSDGVWFQNGTRVRATKPHQGFLTWEITAVQQPQQ